MQESLIDAGQAPTTPTNPWTEKTPVWVCRTFRNCAGIPDLTAFWRVYKSTFDAYDRREVCVCVSACVRSAWPCFWHEMWEFAPDVSTHTPDWKLCMTSRDLGVGNGTSTQLASDNNRMLENMPVVLNNADTDKVKWNKCTDFCLHMIYFTQIYFKGGATLLA